LNELAKQKLLGEEPDITEFMEKWGQFFPPGIETFDQLMEYMEQQMAQMQSLLNSMSPEQRTELQNMMDALLQDNRLQWDLFELAQNMERLNPDAFPDSRFNLMGDEPLSMQEALELMGELNSMDNLEEDLLQAIRSNDPSDISSEEVGRLLGEESKRYADELKRMIRELEEAGFIKKGEHGMELTPKAIRKIGEKALDDIFRTIRGTDFGDHEREKGGVGVELMDETKKWQFGDPFHLNTLKTISNAVVRTGKGTPVRIAPDDFEVNYTTNQVQSSTVIALDMSYSMMWSGYFQAGQRVGLALDTLIRTKYPKDNVTVLAFSYFVLPLESHMLLDTHWIEYGGGTNFQEVLRYARQVLKRQNGTKQIVLITDGEPTTYNYVPRDDDFAEDDPMEQFERMYRRRSKGMVEETLREVVRCTRDHITINTFMLDRDPALLQFVKQMSKVNRGRAFVADANELGSYVVSDYFTNRNKVIS
ncbi:MAG: VWA domain-containing protein, partial [Dehalococcoidia bacterium]